ncbi:cupin domain-containing protein [Rhodovulum iodosum]|uniref:cupin domain-containing protein n=1 Tax=Rhodovulum iodosum TaxID=68291 RepID=UPI0034DAC0FA
MYEAAGLPMQGGDGEKFSARIAPIGAALGLTGLGMMFITVAPGKRAFPFHNHLGNDEAFVILEGRGTYRFGTQEHPVGPGDVCAAPKGGPDRAHQLINTGETDLKYLGISTNNDPDVVEYPDSGKFAVLAVAPGTSFVDAHLKFIGRAEETGDYWNGEL